MSPNNGRGFGRTDDRYLNDNDEKYRLLPQPGNGFAVTRSDTDNRDTRINGNRTQRPINRNTEGSGSRFEQRNPSGRRSGMPQEWQDALERLIAIADSNASKSLPGKTPQEQFEHTQRHVFLRMLFLMAGKHQQAMEPIRGIDLADQEFWSQTMWALSNYFQSDNIPDSEERASQTIAQLRSAIQRLQQNAKLEIRNLSFCHKITNFGNYQKFEQDEFRAGQNVLVYVEVVNFKSDLTDGGKYRTLLKSEIEISKVTSSGSGLIEKFRFDPTEDLCRNRRQDYFHSYQITIPKAANRGPHVLKLIVVDQQGQKFTTETINFTVR